MISKKGSVGIATSIKWGQVSWNIASCFACEHFSNIVSNVSYSYSVLVCRHWYSYTTAVTPPVSSRSVWMHTGEPTSKMECDYYRELMIHFPKEKLTDRVTYINELNVTTTLCVTCVYTCLVSRTKQKAIGGYSYITNYSLSVSK